MTKTLSQYILIILVAAFLAPAKGAAQARLIVDDSTKVSSVKAISKKAKKQQKTIEAEMLKGETIEMLTDTVKKAQEGKLPADTARLRNMAESVTKENLKKAANAAFVPDPKRALWLALVCPGAGQIYNRKYWKLPIFYGGFLGCTYALMWNQQMYRDYSQAYLDIMDDDPNTKSYLNMLPPNYDITGKEERFKTILSRHECLCFRGRLHLERNRRLCRCSALCVRHFARLEYAAPASRYPAVDTSDSPNFLRHRL